MFVGFIGMCIPNFLLALLLMYASSRYFGIHVSGLFSAEFAAQPEWSWAKTRDLLQHIWVPVVVIGAGGTAAMIRVMRGNLLDELRKPYVITARAKGVRPLKLLIKFPIHTSLNWQMRQVLPYEIKIHQLGESNRKLLRDRPGDAFICHRFLVERLHRTDTEAG